MNINPMEEILKSPAKSIGKLLFENGFNRSGVTTLSFLVGVLAIKFINDRNYIYAGICYGLSHLFDFVGDEFSLLSGKVTNFEKNYTLIKNMIIHGIILYYIYIRYSNYEGCSSKNIFLVLLAVLVLSFMQTGCRKLQNDPNEYENETIISKIAMDVCPVTNKEDAYSYMKILRYFSETTIVIIMTGLILMMGEYS